MLLLCAVRDGPAFDSSRQNSERPGTQFVVAQTPRILHFDMMCIENHRKPQSLMDERIAWG